MGRISAIVAVCIPLSDDNHQMVRDSSKKRTGQHGRNSNCVATIPHAAVVFHMQPFNLFKVMKRIKSEIMLQWI